MENDKIVIENTEKILKEFRELCSEAKLSDKQVKTSIEKSLKKRTNVKR